MTIQEQFFKASGIDLSDKEVSGKTPYLKDGKWSSMERGLAWQKYALWLEQQIFDKDLLLDAYSAQAKAIEELVRLREEAAWDARGKTHLVSDDSYKGYHEENVYQNIEDWRKETQQ